MPEQNQETNTTGTDNPTHITGLGSLKDKSTELKANVQKLGVNNSLDTVVSGAIKVIEKSLTDLKQKKQAAEDVKTHAGNVIKEINLAFPNNDSKGKAFDGSFDKINDALVSAKDVLDKAPKVLSDAQQTLQSDKVKLTKATQDLTDAQNAFTNYVKDIQTQIDLINKFCVGALAAVDNKQSTEAYIYSKLIDVAQKQLKNLTKDEKLTGDKGLWKTFDAAYESFCTTSQTVALDQTAVTTAQDNLKAAKPDYEKKLASFINDVINNVPADSADGKQASNPTPSGTKPDDSPKPENTPEPDNKNAECD